MHQLFLPLSPPSRSHLWNAALLLASVAIALVVDRISAAPDHRLTASSASSEISAFVAPANPVSPLPTFTQTLASDPFERELTALQAGVASAGASPTVPAVAEARARGSRLTAILIADERRVAVIDDRTVVVGDVLRDGSRVSQILPDRVWVAEKNGRLQMLTLTTGGR